MWSGSINNIPNGFALCDGTNGTPNLSDRFIKAGVNIHSLPSTGSHNHSVSTVEYREPPYIKLFCIKKMV